MSSALLAALVLSAPAPAGDKTCRKAVARMEEAPVAVYRVDSERLPYHRLSLLPAPGSDEAGREVLLRLHRFEAPDGTTWEGGDRMTCDGDVLALHRFTRRTAVQDVEDYHPALPWLPVPLEPGTAWEWTGVLTVGPAEAGIRTVADALFRVGEPEEVEVPAGAFTAVPVRMELSVAGTQVRTTSWMLPEAPFTLVQREREYLDAQGAVSRTDRFYLVELRPRG